MRGEGSICDFVLGTTAGVAKMPALIQPGWCLWTYEELRELVGEVAATLTVSGLRQEDTVAVLMPDGAAGLVSQLGAMDVCGCAPLDPSLTGPELRRDLIELGVRAIICSPDHSLGIEVAEELGLMCVFASSTGGRCAWAVAASSAKEQNFRCLPKSNLGAAILLPTSATTGSRKIVPLTTANLKASCENTRASLRLSQEDRLLVMARLFHAQGILSAMSQWSVGGCVIVPGDSGPVLLTESIFEHGVTWYTCGPTLHQAILAELRRTGRTRPHVLRFIRSGGNTLPAELKRGLREQLGVPVLDMYGLSETGAVAATPLDEPAAEGWRSVGPEICVMSRKGEPLGREVEGEITVRGPSVMSGYWNDDAANLEAFWDTHEGRWFRTGDLGRMDHPGNLTMSGRAKEIINRGAQKIRPNEVDLALRQHPAVKAVAAFGIPHPTLGEDVACAVVLQDGASVTEAELQAFARKSLARYKVPRKVHFVSEIPHGATGKPQRLILRELLSPYPLPGSSADALTPEEGLNSIESVLAEMWARRLGCGPVQLHDDFFQLGGDSLEATSMLAEVETLVQVKHAPEVAERFFQTPTLRMLCVLVSEPAERRTTSSEIGVYPLAGSGTEIEAFLLTADNDQGWYYRSLSRYMGRQRRMSIVRPENGFYVSAPDTIELSAARATKVIQESRPCGPYLIGGFCLGGLIAYETARLLEQRGETVLLVLFDSPFPGEPHVVRGGKLYVQFAIELMQGVLDGKKNWRNVANYIRLVLRRVLWHILVSTKGVWRGLSGSRLMEWLRRESQMGYLPLYRPVFSRLPILHFVSDQDHGLLWTPALRAWRKWTSAELHEVSLPATHQSMFTDANQIEMNEAIYTWAKAQMKK